MIAKTGLLVVTNPKHISKLLPKVQKQVKNTLYIHLTSALKPLGVFNPDIFTTIPKYSQSIRVIYSEVKIKCYMCIFYMLLYIINSCITNNILGSKAL